MSWVIRLFQSSIGKKTLMAATGLVLFAFLVGHLAGNLQMFIPDGGKKINDYAEFLKHNLVLLWGTRLTLLACVTVHIAVAFQLAAENGAARPVAYQARQYREATYASRTMILSGPMIAAYAAYHLLHFTFGSVHPSFSEHDVHHNVIAGFQVPWVSGAYIVAMILLGTHLYHGLWSMGQTLGLNHPKYNALLRAGSAVVAVAIAGGFASIPVAVLAGVLK